MKRIRKMFPCINCIGLQPDQVNAATIRVQVADDELMRSHANKEECDYGRQVSLQFNTRAFYSFTRLDGDPVVMMNDRVDLLSPESLAVYVESKKSVADLFQVETPPIVIVEVKSTSNEFSSSFDIIIHRVKSPSRI